MPQSNLLKASQPGVDYIYRADILPGGDVTLVAFPPTVNVPPRPGTIQQIELTATEYMNLHAMFAASNLKLMFIDGEFKAVDIGTIS